MYHVLLMIYCFPVGSTEWLRTDAIRTTIGLDLDLEALEWCLENKPEQDWS